MKHILQQSRMSPSKQNGERKKNNNNSNGTKWQTGDTCKL